MFESEYFRSTCLVFRVFEKMHFLFGAGIECLIKKQLKFQNLMPFLIGVKIVEKSKIIEWSNFFFKIFLAKS